MQEELWFNHPGFIGGTWFRDFFAPKKAEKERYNNSRALENRRLDFKNKWDELDCSQKKLDEQAAEFDANIEKMFQEANLKSAARKTEDKTLTYVALGVGALVIGVVAYVALKKKPATV